MSKLLTRLFDVAVAALLCLVLWGVFVLDNRYAPPLAPPPTTAPAKKITLAVTPSASEGMAELLERLGDAYQIETIEEEMLLDPEQTKKYEVVFLTCEKRGVSQKGLKGSDGPSPLSLALRKYVADGGTLYASDLRYDDLSEAFPRFVDRRAVAQGLTHSALSATVEDPGLRAVVGKTVNLDFDIEGWRPAAFRGKGLTVYLRGSFEIKGGVTLKDVPLLVRFPYGKGAVLFTSFHNSKQKLDLEDKLLKYLVLSSLTARVETQIERGGFSPKDKSLLTPTPDNPSVTKTLQQPKVGPLRFSLGFEARGARYRLTVVPPKGDPISKEGDSTLEINIPDASPGQWTYTAEARELPFKDCPYVLAAGDPTPPPAVEDEPDDGKKERGPAIRFVEIPLEATHKAKAGPTRIGVTEHQKDDMGKLLEKLGQGYRYDPITNDDLITPASLDQFDIVFLTCGFWPREWAQTLTGVPGDMHIGGEKGTIQADKKQRVAETLRRFVTGGGTLYASDLRGDMVYDAFPNRQPQIRANLDILPQVEEAERMWIAARTGARKIDTVAEWLRKATLSNTLREHIDLLIALVESSSLSDGDFSPKHPARPIVEKLLEDTNPSPADIDAIAKALESWDRAIRDAQPRSRRNLLRPQGDIDARRDKLMALRSNIFSRARGRGDQTITATIADPGLREALGAPTISLAFSDSANGWMPALFSGNDVTEFVTGEFVRTTGEKDKAPLLVKFPEGKGTVIFTSFHNEKVNGPEEKKLLNYLVLSAMTANEETATNRTLLQDGKFSPAKRSLQAHTPGDTTVPGSYRSARPGRIRFALTVSGEGARMKFTLIAPNGFDKFEKEVSSTLVVEVPEAPEGEWTYMVTALKVPFEKFPYSVSVVEAVDKPPGK